MLIHELCKACGLTKKAVNYYLEQGLLKAEKDTNGYRLFTEQHVEVLKEITLLRKLGAGIADIRRILAAEDRGEALAEFAGQLARQRARLEARQEVLVRWQRQPAETEAVWRYAANRLGEPAGLKERIALAFPGPYGQFLALHFGPFLNAAVETDDQQAAYESLVGYLDETEWKGMPPELERELEQALGSLDTDKLAGVLEETKRTIENIDDFLQDEKNRQQVRDYLNFRSSPEYEASPAKRLSELLCDFQHASGYQERFIANLRQLSPDYDAYVKRLAEADKKLLSAFPEASRLNR